VIVTDRSIFLLLSSFHGQALVLFKGIYETSKHITLHNYLQGDAQHHAAGEYNEPNGDYDGADDYVNGNGLFFFNESFAGR
jgi:hypothetical protein